jgi:hypothetical protein
MGERLAYLPLAFLTGIVAVALFAFEARTGVRGMAAGILGILVVASGVRTVARNPDWHTELTLWEATAKAAPRSFKSHSALAEALYDSDATHANFDRVVAEKEASLALIADLPHPEETPEPYRRAAAYYLERGDLQRPRDAGAAAASYTRAVELVTRYLALLDVKPLTPADRTNGELLLATVQERLQNSDAALTAARAALAREPLNPMSYRTTASALLSARQNDEAASILMTGFMLTGQPELRAAVIEIYNAGLDAAHCAISPGANGATLNPDCAIVRRHLCAAAATAAAVHRAAGRDEMARQVEASTGGRCTP